MNTALLVKRCLHDKLFNQIYIRSDFDNLVLKAVVKDNIFTNIFLIPTKKAIHKDVNLHWMNFIWLKTSSHTRPPYLYMYCVNKMYYYIS